MMRNIVETLTCDLCGKKELVTYVHIGSDLKIDKAGLLPLNAPPVIQNEKVYEVEPTKHHCGACLKLIYAMANAMFSRS